MWLTVDVNLSSPFLRKYECIKKAKKPPKFTAKYARVRAITSLVVA